jgi:glycosyltransferase involved in cell wall biosynthesis
MERRPAPHSDRGRGGRRPEAIVVHTTDGSFEGAAAWFADPRSGVSVHHLVGLDGRVTSLVDEADTARHAGRVVEPSGAGARLAAGGDVNARTIGIEFADDGDPLGVVRPAAQYRAGGRLLAAIAARWDIPLDREHVIGHREIRADKTCPGNLDLDRLLDAARHPDPVLACLLPVRDGERDLPGWLESVRGLADVVLALDDGSTDATRALLEADPLVRRVLHNDPRPDAAGWDDAANRNALLAAADEIAPDWVLFLDADERIDAADADALRRFLASPDALPGCAYGLQHFRAWGADEVEESPSIVWRLFGHREGQRLAPVRLHGVPVPEQIPRATWVPTTIRLRHLGADGPRRLAERAAKYAAADPRGEWPTDFGGLHAPPEGSLVRWGARPAALPVLGGAPAPVGASTAAPVRPRLALLVPARNAAADLPGWLDGVRDLADAVVALDDGSTDDTAAVLDADPLVSTLLRHPRREGYAGWDDARNRTELLDAARALDVDWALFLDADERIDPDDRAALRAWLDAGEADPDAAYGFRVHRMQGDLGHYDQAGLWVFRLFAVRPDRTLPTERLHHVPVPVEIPAERRRRTTVRIQHLGSADADRRAARYAKYEEADPDREHQASYEALLAGPGTLRAWAQRPPGLPVVAPTASGPADLHDLDLDGPELTAIVIAREDAERIERVVRSVVEQDAGVPFEVIVVVSGSPATAAVVRERFGERVTLVELPDPVLPGAARNAGLALARGDVISFPGSHCELPPGSLAARARAHARGMAMVTGTILNGNPTPAGWASYFLDHAGCLPSRPSGALAGPPAHCSYDGDALRELGGFPEHLRAGEDTVVNTELWRRGHRAWREQDVRLIHASPCRTVGRLLRHHHTRGRGYGRILAEQGVTPMSRAAWRAVGPSYLPRRLRSVRRQLRAHGAPGIRRVAVGVSPLVLAGATAAWVGALRELALRSRAGR